MATWEHSGHPFGEQDTNSSQQTLDVTECKWIETYVLSKCYQKKVRARAKMIKVFLKKTCNTVKNPPFLLIRS